MKSIKFALLVGIVSAGCAYAIRDITSLELVKELRIGWNLGDSLDALCTDWLDYNNDQTASETCWGNVKASQDLFTALMNKGINVFRVPITWTGHIGNGPNYTIDKEWLERVHEVVNYSYQNGAYVIINTHHENWVNTYHDKIEHAKEITVKLWEQIAEEFKDYDEHLIFECMNSPRKIDSNTEYDLGDDESWEFINEINKVFIETVRQAKGNNSKRHLLISPYRSLNDQGTVRKLEFPSHDKKIMVSLHGNIPYDDFNNGHTDIFSKITDIEWTLNTINQQFIAKNIPVIMTEFYAANRADNSERILLADYYIKKATDISIPCVLWDNGKLEYGNENYGLINRTTYEIKYPDYLNTLIEASYSSVDERDKENHSKQNNKIDSTLKLQSGPFKHTPVFSKRSVNSNIKVEPYTEKEGETAENIIFSSVNKMIALNGTKSESEPEQSNGAISKRNVNDDIKIEQYTENEGEVQGAEIFSTNNKVMTLNEKENEDIKVEPYPENEGEPQGEVIFSTTNQIIALNKTENEENKNNNEGEEQSNGTTFETGIRLFCWMLIIILMIILY